MSEFDNVEIVTKSDSFDEKQWGMFVHISQFANCIAPPLGIVAPIILWLMKKEESKFVDEQGKIVINWMISCFIYAIISAILMIIFIGMVGFFALGITGLIFPIIGAIKASEGKTWDYPLSIRFLK